MLYSTHALLEERKSEPFARVQVDPPGATISARWRPAGADAAALLAVLDDGRLAQVEVRAPVALSHVVHPVSVGRDYARFRGEQRCCSEEAVAR
eukprot:301714-Pyramimonas_sp.AAC.1